MEVVQLSTLELVAFAMTSLGGLLINFLNKAATEKLTWKDYWSSKPLNTVASILVSSGMFVSLILSGETNHLTYISASFMADVLINRSYQGAHGDKERAKTKNQ